jgi:hypothetical protein
MNTKLVRVPLPKLGSGYRVLRGLNGQLTTVPLRDDERALYGLPTMAMDGAPAIGGPPGSPNYRDYNPTAPTNTPRPAAGSATGDDDPDDFNPAADDTEDQVRQLLEGKLSPEDLEALCALIFPDDTAPAPAQDRKRQARDQRLTMPSRAEIMRRIAAAGEVRAARALKSHEALISRFPALKNARVA